MNWYIESEFVVIVDFLVLISVCCWIVEEFLYLVKYTIIRILMLDKYYLMNNL